jgi:TonB family protein
MSGLIEFWQSSGDLLLLNILFQVTLVTLFALAVARAYSHNPAVRYTVLFPALLSLFLVVPISVAVQHKELSMWQLPLSADIALKEGGASSFTFEPISSVFTEVNDFIGMYSLASVSSLDSNADLGADGSFDGQKSFVFSNLVLSLWLLGSAVSLFGLFRSHRKLRWIVKTTGTADSSELRRVTAIANSLVRVDNNYEIKFSSKISSPVLLGIRQPLILMPADLSSSLSDTQLKGVLIHELAHLERNDFAANYCQRLVCSLFWFHPGVWLMDKTISRAREEVCDNYVLADNDPVSYSEVLLGVSSATSKLKAAKSLVTLKTEEHVFSTQLTLGMFGKDWTLEERVKGLLSDKRERAMKLNNVVSKVIQFSMISVSMFLAACQIGGGTSDSIAITASSNETIVQADKQQTETEVARPNNEPRLIPVQSTKPAARSAPQARITAKLGDDVFKIIEEIQLLLETEGGSVDADMAAAKALLDQLTINRFESLNNFEKQTALNFLTNYYLGLQEYREAAAVFQRILTVENIRADVRLRTLRSLGQLYASFEEWDESIAYYSQWRELAAMEDRVVYKGLSYAHYQLEQWSPATQYWENYLQLIEDEDEQPSRSDYAYLNGLYFTADELDKALGLTKEMILLFNEQKDWANLRAIYSMLDARDQVDETVNEIIGQLENSVSEPQISRTSLVPMDGDYLPLIAVQPQYPTVAANDGIEGWALVSFTVREDGLVEEDTVAIVDAEPATVFNKTATRAAVKFEFQPRVVNGKAVPVPGVQYLFRFQLEEEV